MRGKVNGFPFLEYAIGDHPRLCGEKISPFLALNMVVGSPPPMRGKVINHDRFLFAGGITPAYAGKRLLLVIELVQLWDHPRLCGEKIS